jgi:hypothetical protein
MGRYEPLKDPRYIQQLIDRLVRFEEILADEGISPEKRRQVEWLYHKNREVLDSANNSGRTHHGVRF